jgi:hypothetical protein
MEPRPIKELLIILRDNLESLMERGNDGMCACIFDLRYYMERLSTDEAQILYRYLENNMPSNARKRRAKNMHLRRHTDSNMSFCWWTPRSIPPRMRYLNKQINKLP